MLETSNTNSYQFLFGYLQKYINQIYKLKFFIKKYHYIKYMKLIKLKNYNF